VKVDRHNAGWFSECLSEENEIESGPAPQLPVREKLRGLEL
jgi:hypothetical protein